MADDTQQPESPKKPSKTAAPKKPRARKATPDKAPKSGPEVGPESGADATDPVHAQSATEGFFVGLLNQFSVAWLFFARVPLPKWWNRTDVTQDDDTVDQNDKGKGMTPLADTVRAWPVVGLLVGAFAGLVLWIGAKAGLPPVAASILGIAAGALITGALHEDGLADTADGLGGGTDKKKVLAIMRDSHIGTFGVMALVLVVGFKAGSLGGFNAPVFAASALIVAHVLSRAALPMLMVVLSPVRRTGLGKGAGVPKREDAAMAAAIGVLVAILTLGIGPGLAASALAALGVALVGWWAKNRLGGFTGDVLGAAQQIAEVFVLGGLAVIMRTVFYV